MTEDELRDRFIYVGVRWETYRTIIVTLIPVVGLVLLLVGAMRVDAGAVSSGDIVTALYLLSLLTFPIQLSGPEVWDFVREAMGQDYVKFARAQREIPTRILFGSESGMIHAIDAGNWRARPRDRSDVDFSPDMEQTYMYVTDGTNDKVWILARDDLVQHRQRDRRVVLERRERQ